MSQQPFFGSSSARKAHKAKSIIDLADDAGRDLTDDERARVQDLLDGAKVDHDLETKMASIGRELGAPELAPKSPFHQASLTLGERFTNSDGYKSIRNNRGERFSSGLVDVSVGLSTKGTLLEGSGAPGSGTGGG